jgi:hypothetical protein
MMEIDKLLVRHIIPNMSELLTVGIDLEEEFKEIERVGAVSFPFLSGEYREYLVKVSQSLSYYRRQESVGSIGKEVRQQMEACEVFPADSPFVHLRDEFQVWLGEEVSKFTKSPFNPELNFNDLVVQRYQVGSLGITPHRDGASYLNLVALFMLEGEADFYLCDDRTGTNPKQVDTTPGNVLLMRAPGFLESDIQPFHYVTNVRNSRTNFALRQKRS